MANPANISQGTKQTQVNPANWNELVDAINTLQDKVFDVVDYGAVGDGGTDDHAAISDAHTAATVAGGIVSFPPGTYKLSDNLTINSDVTLAFSPGAKLSIDNTKTVTINGHIADTMHQIFSGDGSVAGAPRNDFVRPEWWGAVADGSTDCQAAFELAINFAYNNGVGQVKLSAGVYYIDSTTTFTNVREVTIVGNTTKPQYTSSRTSGSAIVFNGIATGTPGWKFTTCRGLSFENFWMYTAGTKAHSGIYLDQTATSAFNGVNIQNFTTASVFLDQAFSLTFKDCTLSRSDAGVRSSGTCQNITFLGCYLIQNTTCGAWVYGQNYTFIGCDFEGQPRGIDQQSAVGRVNSRGWLIEGNYFEAMTDDEVIYLVFHDYSQLGTAYLSSAAYRIYLNTADHNVIINWYGGIYIQSTSTDNVIVHCREVTDGGVDTIRLTEINEYYLRKDGAVALTADWPAGNHLLTVGDMGVTKTAASYGAELVTNDTFDADTTGWAAVVATLTSEAGGESNNCLKNLSVGGGGAYLSQARQEVTVIPFLKHKISFYFKKGNSISGRVYIDDTAFSRDPTSGDLYDSGPLTDVDWTEHTGEFIPTTSTIYVMLENQNTGQYSLFDEVSIKVIAAGSLAVGGVSELRSDVRIGRGIKHGGMVIAESTEVQTDDNVQTTLDILTLLDENTYHVEAFVVGVKSNGADRASYHIACTVYRTGGGATLEGAVTAIHAVESDGNWDATFTVDGNDLRVSVTGVAATTIEWGTTMKYINMSN